MSVPRLVVCGLEPGPAVALASGALLAAFAEERAVRPVVLGVDVPLWRLLYRVAERAPPDCYLPPTPSVSWTPSTSWRVAARSPRTSQATLW